MGGVFLGFYHITCDLMGFEIGYHTQRSPCSVFSSTDWMFSIQHTKCSKVLEFWEVCWRRRILSQIYINWYAYRIVFHTNIYTHISFDVFHASCPRIGCWDNLQETLILYLQNRGPPVCTRTLDVWVTTENAQLREEVEMFFASTCY